MDGTDSEIVGLIEKIKQACVDAAIAGYEEAGMSGLCQEGAFELAIDRIKSLKADELSKNLPAPKDT